MANFEWQTENEAVWEDQKPASPAPKRPYRSTFIVLGTVLIILLTAIWWVNHQVQESVSSIEEQVRRSYTLFFETAHRKDADLLRSLLSGRDSSWTETQLELVAANGLLDRASFGWRLIDSVPKVAEVQFAPNLQASDVLGSVTYFVPAPAGTVQAATFELPAVLRQASDGRWLFAPPETTFWGNQEELRSERLRLTYPSRDADLALQLFADLETAVRQLCAPELAFHCPADLQLDVTFSVNPQTLQTVAGDAAYEATTTLRLPTPSLVGLPADEAGYEALRLGYARLGLLPLMAELTEYRCCEHGLFFLTQICL